MSGLIRSSVTVLSGTTINNILAGEVFEFLSRPAAVKLLASQVYVSGSLIELDFNLGNVIGALGLQPNGAATGALDGVIDQDRDGFPAAVGQAGDRIQIRARETIGAAGDDGILNYMVQITDLA